MGSLLEEMHKMRLKEKVEELEKLLKEKSPKDSKYTFEF